MNKFFYWHIVAILCGKQGINRSQYQKNQQKFFIKETKTVDSYYQNNTTLKCLLLVYSHSINI